MISNIVSLVNRNIWVLAFPVILDEAALAAGLSLAGFTFHSAFSVRIPLEMGLPSISQLLNQPLLANTLDFMRRDPPLPDYAWFLVLIIVLLRCFAQGGYIGALYMIAAGEKVRLVQLWEYSARNMLRFIMYFTALKLAQTALTLLMAALFGVTGVFLSLVVFLGLRVLFIYLELCMVIDRLSFDAALRRSRRILLDSPGVGLTVVGLMYALTGALSLFFHRYGNVAIVIASIPVYLYVMTIFQQAFVVILQDTVKSKDARISAH